MALINNITREALFNAYYEGWSNQPFKIKPSHDHYKELKESFDKGVEDKKKSGEVLVEKPVLQLMEG